MIIHNATITGSMHLNGMDMSRMTGSLPTEQFNQFTASVNGFTNSYNTASFSGSFKGDGSQLTNISASGIIGLNLSQISSGEAIASIDASGFNVNTGATISGSLIVTNQIVAQSLNVQQVTSSVVFSSGSNVFGNSLANTQIMTGSVSVTGSLKINNQNVVPENRTLSINGIIFDLSANRSWEIAAGVTSFNTRTGAITLSSGDVTTALGYTPYNSTNPNGYISGINSGMVTTALGYTPVPNTRTLTINGTAFDLSADRSWEIAAGVTSVSAGTGISVNQTTGAITITNTITNNNQLTNGAGYITGINSSMVTTALGYTPYNATNPAGYISSYTETDTLASVTGRGSSTSSPITINGGGSQPLTLTTTSGSPWHLALVRNDLGLTSRVFAHNSPYNGWYFEHNIIIAGNTNIHSGNYNSYSPTLTGGGASGTWGISITGNAATITSQANSATITASTGVNASHIVQRDGNGYIYANHINFNTPESENPAISSFITSNGDGWSRKSSIAHVRNQLGNYGGWITGLSFDGLSSKTGGTGTYQTSGDFRAPIFYDSNDTAFYVDPNSSSRLVNLGLGGVTPDVRLSVSGDAHISSYLYMGGTAGSAGSWGIRALSSGGNWTVNANSFRFDNVGYGSTWSLTVDSGGAVIASASMRAPIFYDSNNTTYFLDPGGDSGVRAGVFNGNLWINPRSEGYGEGIAFLMPSQATWGGIRWVRGVSNFTGAWAFGYFGNESNDNIGFHSAGTNGWRLDHSWNMTSIGSVRSPIFYDSNDTAFYVDPNSTSNTNSMRASEFRGNANVGGTGEATWHPAGAYIGGTMWQYGAMYKNNTDIYDISTGYANGSLRAPIFYDNNNTGYYLDLDSTTSGVLRGNLIFNDFGAGIVGTYDSTRYQAVFSMGNSYKLPINGTSVGNLYGIAWSHPNAGGAAGNLASHGMLILENGGFQGSWGGGSLRTPSDIRGTIFYDWNNTGYYVDPASTTNIVTLYVSDWIYQNSSGGMYWNPYSRGLASPENAGNSYGTVTTVGSGRNGWHGWGIGSRHVFMSTTGDNVGVHDNSRGWIWYWNGSSFNIDFGFTNIAGSARSPIFYDSDNTAFYFDGSSTGDSIRVAGDVVAYYSDERLKDIKGNIPDALSKVMSLDGFYYEPNEIAQSYGYEKKLQVGLSAQQVESILPEIIKDAPIGNGYKTVDYGKLVPLLVEAIKEQQQQIEELKSIVNAFTK